MDDLPEVGSEFIVRPPVFRLTINKHVKTIDHTKYSISDPALIIDPNYFFITSGDAIEKVKYMILRYNELIGTIQDIEYKKEIEEARDQVSLLLDKLISAKGPNCFLETEWRGDNTLVVIPKNPRKR